ncbi:uncharacterized protein [Diabrotica undecimpunctata]|uniref:uncharacterized protein n=1 Tax=Diabrotica undecimpunctata TaxID=50387 RepID=UPI003B63C3A5
MGPSVVGRTKIDLCPVCGKPYREERMVECTECKKWCCFECVNVQDDSEVIGDDSWKCPLCVDAATKKSHPQGSKIKKSCSATSLKSSSSTSSKTKMKLQLLQEERDLLRQERELTKESRRIIEEDECSNDSQDIDEEEIIETNPLVNKFLSLNIDKPFIDNIAPLTPTLGKPLPTYNDKSSGILYKRRDPGDLPIFNGNPYDWPVFISSFERSTELCQVDNHENILRLQKCLKGPARVSVSSFLILPQCVPQIIATLKILFGRPEQIIEAHINSIRRLPPPKPEKLETLVEFALAVKNLCVLLEASNLKDYLNNPTLMHELLEKLPSQIKVNWAIYRSAFQNFQGLRELADWLYNLATNVCSALPTLALNDQSNKKRQFNNNVHANIHEPNASSETHNCKLCNQRDCKKIAGCSEFQRYSLSQRWEAVKALNLCRLCLKKHRFPCKYPVKCNKEECQRKHHPLLHEFSEQVSNKSTKLIKKESGMQTVESHLLSADEESNAHQGTRFRILPVVLRNGSREVTTFAFLDEGSSVTLLEESVAKKLNIMGNPEQLCLKWTGNQQRLEDASEKVFFSIAGDYNGAKEFDHRPARTVRKLGLPKQTLDAKAIKESFPYLKNLPFKSYKNAVPQILIGLDNWDLALPLRVKEGLELQPIAAKSRLGWTIFAMFSNNDVEINYSYHICECSSESITNQELFNSVKDFFSVESLGVQNIKPSVSKELDRAIRIQESTLVQIEKKYIRKLSEQELLEHQEKTWYLPIFPAFNPNKPDKFRLVWDAAATVQGISLNSMLLKGDDQLASLLGVLLRFRERKIGFSGDIKEMFLRVGIIEEDQHAQRFLWRNGSSDNPLEVYVMTVMTFGATCSPSCAQFVKNTNAKKFSVEYPSAVDSIVKNHYVDDLLESTDTEDEAIQLAKEIALIHASGNFEIRNWRSNSEKLIKIMNTTHGNNEEVNLDIGNNKSMEKVLGECGLLANFLIYVKILLQEIWRSNISWDQPITNEQFQKWLVWLKQLPEIEKVSIPRYFLNKLENWKDTNTQMHIFVDASEHASACVAYLRIMKKDVIECTLIGAKTHVAPLKPQTIPRLELNGAKTVNKSNSLYKLSPYLDEDGLLRIRGRLDEARDVISETKRPIILPRGSRLTLLIIEDYHKRYHHRNHEIVVNEIRQKFYIPKLRQLVKKIRTNCQNCKVKFAKPKPPEMSPLPPCRLATFTAPFTLTGMDYFGPINVTVGRRTEKRWGALFTCLTTAVHLEVAYKLDVDSFILCLTNFINRRGRPRHIYCDRGTNFIAAERVLREELQKVDSKLIANSLISPELKFHFNAPLSPHMGGAWERLVKAVKISLYDSLPSRNPTDQLLHSCLIAAENIVNSRPLTYLPIESEESESLTPNHFLIGSSNGDKPIGFLNEDVKVFKFNYLYREQFANKCWRRFISEYIPELLLRAKWHKQVVPIKQGDIVIICDKDLPRCNWPKGKVIEVKKSSDGQVRRAIVQTKNGIYERPVIKLAVISINGD